MWNLPLWLREAIKARHVSGMSLHGDTERLLCKAVKVNPGLCWRLQDAGDARVMGHLPRTAAKMVWNQPKREKEVAVIKAERS